MLTSLGSICCTDVPIKRSFLVHFAALEASLSNKTFSKIVLDPELFWCACCKVFSELSVSLDPAVCRVGLGEKSVCIEAYPHAIEESKRLAEIVRKILWNNCVYKQLGEKFVKTLVYWDVDTQRSFRKCSFGYEKFAKKVSLHNDSFFVCNFEQSMERLAKLLNIKLEKSTGSLSSYIDDVSESNKTEVEILKFIWKSGVL